MKITDIRPKVFINNTKFNKPKQIKLPIKPSDNVLNSYPGRYSNTFFVNYQNRLPAGHPNAPVFLNKRNLAAATALLLLVCSASGIKMPKKEAENSLPAAVETSEGTAIKKAPRKRPLLPRQETIEQAVEAVEAQKVPETTKGEDMVKLAETFLGLDEEGVEEICGYDLPDGLWCAAFVKYLADTIYGEDLPEWYTADGYNKCGDVLYYAKENDCAFKDYKQAKPGDIVIFDFGSGMPQHMGIVAGIEDGVLTTIEGNAGKEYKVISKTYDLIENPDRVFSFVKIAEE